MVLKLIGWLSLGALVEQNKQALYSWLHGDWAHWAAVIFGSLLLSFYAALCIIEKETDSARLVSLLSETIEPKLLPEAELGPVDFVSGRPKLKLENVLQLLYVAKIRNENSAPVRVVFPSFELLARVRGLLWRRVPISIVRESTWGHIGKELWHHNNIATAPGGDQVTIRFQIHFTSERGAAAFLGQDLRLRGLLDVIGKPKVPLDIRLSRVEK